MICTRGFAISKKESTYASPLFGNDIRASSCEISFFIEMASFVCSSITCTGAKSVKLLIVEELSVNSA